MRLADVNPQSVKKIDKKELMNLHKRVHQLWGGAKAAGFPSKKMKKWLKDVHQILVDEMERRGINHKSPLLEGEIIRNNIKKIETINEIYLQEGIVSSFTLAILLQSVALILSSKQIKEKVIKGCGKVPEKTKWYGSKKDRYKFDICYYKGFIKEYKEAIKKIEKLKRKCKDTKSPKVCESKMDAKISKVKIKIAKLEDQVKRTTQKLKELEKKKK